MKTKNYLNRGLLMLALLASSLIMKAQCSMSPRAITVPMQYYQNSGGVIGEIQLDYNDGYVRFSTDIIRCAIGYVWELDNGMSRTTSTPYIDLSPNDFRIENNAGTSSNTTNSSGQQIGRHTITVRAKYDLMTNSSPATATVIIVLPTTVELDSDYVRRLQEALNASAPNMNPNFVSIIQNAINLGWSSTALYNALVAAGWNSQGHNPNDVWNIILLGGIGG